MAIPKIKSGYLIYHTYTSYNELDSQLYLLDFSTKEKICISDYLPDGAYNAMNGHINATEDKVVFMGIINDEWEIFLFDIPSRTVQQLSTYGRNEDPKFSPTGNKIVYKKGVWSVDLDCMIYAIVEYDLDAGTEATEIISYSPAEVGMPYYDNNMEYVYYVCHDVDNSTINRVNINTLMIDVVIDDVANPYYPIIRGDFMTFSYDYSKDKKENLVAKYNLKTGERTLSKFNSEDYNVSDAYIVDNSYTVVSCTKAHSNYDLWLINFDTGEAIPMDEYGVNTTDKQELGSCLSSIVFEEQKQAVPSDLFKRGLTDVLDKAKAYAENRQVTTTISWADYQALSEEEKKNGTLYDIPDMPTGGTDDFLRESDITTVLDATSTNKQVVGAKALYEKTKDTNIKTYAKLEELGLAAPVTTFEVFSKMPPRSFANIPTRVNGVQLISDLPETTCNGILIIDKYDAKCFSVMFKRSNETSFDNYLSLAHFKTVDGSSFRWDKVCTTSVSDVDKTSFTVNSDTTNYEILVNSNSNYLVRNGVCYVSLCVLCNSPSSSWVELCTIPKCASGNWHNSISNLYNNDLTDLFVKAYNGFLYARNGSVVTSSQPYYINFSYPVATV